MISAWLRLLVTTTLLSIPVLVHATLTPDLQRTIRAATFEVVMKKPARDPVSYEKPLPLDLLPYQVRTDAYESVGTAFALGGNLYVTAAHVVEGAVGSQWGPPELRRSDGSVFEIDRIVKFSAHEDFVVFSLRNDPQPKGLSVNRDAKVDDPVLAVGNALGEGIVIRDGLLTSETPEEQDGRWKWLRFSAAASPGNSGGPLCDSSGNVIGIVIGKSPNENLNYSLPISLVLDADSSKARFDDRSLATLPFLEGTATYAYKDEFQLPLSWSEFSDSYRKARDHHDDESRSRLLEQYRESLFPKGPGVDDIVFDPHLDTEPRLVLQGSDATWYSQTADYDEVRLSGDGTASAAYSRGARLLHLVRPDRASDDAFYQDSKAFMDLALKILDIRRTVGRDNVRVTSLGRAAADEVFKDPFGRKWQQRVWAIPYEDSYVLGMLLPTPDGYDAILKTIHSDALHSATQSVRLLAGLMDVSYSGTLVQWQAALHRADLLPQSLESLKLVLAPNWMLHTSKFDSSVPPAVLQLTDQSLMHLTMGFTRGKEGAVAWEVQQVWWMQDEQAKSAIGISRWAQPSPGTKLELRNRYADMRARRTPFDGSPSRDSPASFSATIILDVPGRSPGTISGDVAYSLTVRSGGQLGLVHTQSSVENLQASTRILERGDGSVTAGRPSEDPTSDEFATIERNALESGMILDKLAGKDIRGRIPSQDLQDFIASMREGLASASSNGSDEDRRRVLEQERQRLTWLSDYWEEFPALTHNREMWSSFLLNNHLPPDRAHEQSVINAESELRSTLAKPISAEWRERAHVLRNAYIEERIFILKSVPQRPLLFRDRVTDCPPPAETTSGKRSPAVGHAGHSLQELWPPESKRLGEGGTVLARVRISPTGCVTSLAIAGSSGSDLMDGAVRDYLQSVTFFPAELDGKAIETTVTVPVTFQLE